MTLSKVLIVFLGGGLGSVLRYLLSDSIARGLTLKPFWATLVVNIIGCFLIGVASGLIRQDSLAKYLFITGFCGGFTTFSTFSAENVHLWQQGQYFQLLLYIFLSLFVGFLAVIAGKLIISY